MLYEWPSYDFLKLLIFVRSHNFDLIVNIFEKKKKKKKKKKTNYVWNTIIMYMYLSGRNSCRDRILHLQRMVTGE